MTWFQENVGELGLFSQVPRKTALYQKNKWKLRFCIWSVCQSAMIWEKMTLAGSSKTAPRILIFFIVMGAIFI